MIRKIIHAPTAAILAALINNSWVLVLLHILLPTAIYFETGPITAISVFFGYYLLITLVMYMKEEEETKAIASKMMKEYFKSQEKKRAKKEAETSTKH